MARIMTIGEILVEIMATERGQSFRAPGTLVGPFPRRRSRHLYRPGGPSSGRPARIIGCVGDDDFGWLNIDRLRRDGVDTSAIALLPDAVTGSAFVTYTETGERHFIFSNIADSASGRLSASSITESVLADCAWFHVMGFLTVLSGNPTAAVRKAIGMVKRRGGMISFDPEHPAKEILQKRGHSRSACDRSSNRPTCSCPAATRWPCSWMPKRKPRPSSRYSRSEFGRSW